MFHRSADIYGFCVETSVPYSQTYTVILLCVHFMYFIDWCQDDVNKKRNVSATNLNSSIIYKI